MSEPHRIEPAQISVLPIVPKPPEGEPDLLLICRQGGTETMALAEEAQLATAGEDISDELGLS